ncbi:MAG: glycosyltransferase, partial [Terriglobia bacterium]
PYDAYAPGAIKHLLRPLFRRWFSHRLRRQCAAACAAAYVTAEALQRRYPPGPGVFQTDYSSIELPEEAFIPKPRSQRPRQRRFRLITVGSLEHLYKAPDVLLGAASACVRSGLDIEVVFVGEGRQRSKLQARVRASGLEKRVWFRGQLPAGKEVRAELNIAS